MSSPHTYSRALALLREMLGPRAQFRAGQWEAIEAVVEHRGRALVVQRTGWGKSLVYFLATKILRDQGSGPTLLVSPLLSLMRNQIEAAAKIGINAFTINSANLAEWEAAEGALADDACDILMISPERLGNERFKKSLLHGLGKRIGLFVVDEVHCISDWGHDFRPDYRRLINVIDKLPSEVPVLGTTATANNRVIADVRRQLGEGLTIFRGPLVRTSLRLQNIVLPSQAERLAWLAQNIGKFKGSGVVYCLTVADVERVANWLNSKGISAQAYHAGDDAKLDRVALEQSLIANEIKVLVATVALGMGFDKPDLAFVIHFQRPGSVVAYYQQVGRAGRAVDRAYGILLSGVEDDEIQDYFIQSAFPSSDMMGAILEALSAGSLSMNQLLALINVSHSMTERALKLLEIEGAVLVEHDGKSTRYRRALRSWQPNEERARRVSALREAEVTQMRAYVKYRGCLMEFLTHELDDPQARPCGVCANCQGRGFSTDVEPEIVQEAIAFLRGAEIIIPPRKRWPRVCFPISAQ
jgi:ATP-dependent DNA helicase RecQ